MQGYVASGERKAARFVPAIEDLVVEELGFHPFPGTLNLTGVDVESLPERVVEDPTLGMDNCRGVGVRPCSAAGVRAGVVRPLVAGYSDHRIELVAPVGLRRLFALSDGDPLPLSPAGDLGSPDGPVAVGDALDAFDAVVFDLDNTLVELAVEWEAVRADLADLFSARLPGVDPTAEGGFHAVAREHGFEDEYASLVAEYEVAGADAATALPLLDVVDRLDCSVGVCTRNASAAADRVLARFGVREAVDAVVARETVPDQKPHPEPLRRCLSALDAVPGDAVFVGDDATDREAAERAGTSYLHPDRVDPGA